MYLLFFISLLFLQNGAILSYTLSNNQHVYNFEKTDTPTLSVKCGYSSCPVVKEGMLNVHLVPHTHDDVGWLKTVDQYYYGSRRDITPVGVQYILDSVIDQLVKNPQRRFIYVEIAFFERWWREQNEAMQQVVKGLVNEGRLEFIIGGWCMNDEAATHYNAIIDQHTLGLQFLQTHFGDCGRPRVAWQIDPFGHSREMASLFAQMGFDGLFHGRIDYEDRENRKKQQTMEMLWHASPDNLGAAGDIFTGILNSSYSPPPGFCFDVYCDSEPIMDDPTMHDYNVNKRVDEFLAQVEYQRPNYKTQNILMTMGEDFNYVAANTWFKNLDKLIKYTNQRQTNGSKVNLLYSTPSCYLQQLYNADLTWPTKTDDFFPYAHRPHGYWTGYFTSRPTHKRFSRYGNNVLQVVKQLSVFANLTDDQSFNQVDKFRKVMGVVQHHDAITGTAKQQVADDYAERLNAGLEAGQDVIISAYKRLLPLSGNPADLVMVHCNLLNISQCSVSEKYNQFAVVIYNPLPRQAKSFIELPVLSQYTYTVIGPFGDVISSSITPIPEWIQDIPERKSEANIKLSFQYSLPPTGFSTYFVHRSDKKISRVVHKENLPHTSRTNDGFILSNNIVSLVFDSSNQLKTYINHRTNLSYPLAVEFGYYMGMPGNNSKPEYTASGAYLFRPQKQDLTTFKSQIVKVVRTDLVQEVWQQFGNWVQMVTRLYKDSENVIQEWTVGPIPIYYDIGKEVVVRYSVSNINNKGVFYTDSNGREIIKRVRNHRETWQLETSEPVASNYYPVNTRIYIKDGQDTPQSPQLTVLTDRSQGGSSLVDGHIELMLHRRLLYDDALGVGEPLNETGSDGKGLRVTGRHTLVIGTVAAAAKAIPDDVRSVQLSPVFTFVPDVSQESWSQQFKTNWSALSSGDVPPNINILTLEQWDKNKCLLRLENFYEKSQISSENATVNIQTLFENITFKSIDELTLAANQKLSDMKRFNWKTQPQSSFVHRKFKHRSSNVSSFIVTLSPMQIRTFLLEY